MRTDKKVWRNRKARKELARRLQSENPGLEVVHPHAAGIDVGNGAHYAAVRPDRDSQPVRRFECFTADLYRLADWLQSCGVQTVALQLAGVYWIPLYNILEERGFEVYLVNARHTKNDVQEKPVAAEVTHLRTVEQLIPTVRDSHPAHLLAAATTTRHGSSDLCPTYAASCLSELFAQKGSGQPETAWVTPLSQKLAQPRNTKEFLQVLVQIDKLQSTVGRFRRNVQTDNSTQPGTVQVAHIRQIQHNAFAFRKQGLDRRF
jgi:hypothetical protein